MRFPTRLLTPLAALALLLGLAGCDSVSNMLSPGQPASTAPARVSFEAVIPRFQESSFTRVELRVTAAYQRDDNTFVTMGTQLLTLTGERTQQLPVRIELGRCLSDPLRREAAVDPRSCFVRLTLTLLGDGRELDDFDVLGLVLSPGASAALPQAVRLFEVAAVEITAAGSSDPLPATGTTLDVGSTLALGVRAIDGSGQPITGRTATWSATNSAAATVSAAGQVTGVAPGVSSIIGTIGGRADTIAITVTPPTRALTVTAAPSNGVGRVRSTPAGIDCAVNAGVTSGTCTFAFPLGTAVQLAATPESATTARFSGWTGACVASGTLPTCELLMDQPRTTGAGFTALTLVRVRAGRAFSGITAFSTQESAVSGQFLSCALSGVTGNCDLPFVTGTQVTIDITESGIARAIGWSGCEQSTRTACTLSLTSTSPRVVTLDATPGNLVVVQPGGAGSGRVTAPNVGGSTLRAPIDCGAAVPPGQQVCTSGYPIGSTVTLTAAPAPTSRFVGWGSSPCTTVNGVVCTIANTSGIGGDLVVTPQFEPNVAPVTFQLSGTGGGTVRANGGAVCTLGVSETSRQCVVDFALGSSLSLTGSATGNGRFVGFGGACPLTTTCTQVVNAPLTITASFDSTPPLITINVLPTAGNTGAGFVLSTSPGIACDIVGTAGSGSCAMTRPRGSVVTLTANDDIFILTSSAHVFRRWGPTSPCPNSPEPVCSFVVGATNTVVDASFVRAASVGMLVNGDGPGVLQRSVTGFRSLPNCVFNGQVNGVDCDSWVPLGSQMTFTGFPGPNVTLFTSGFPFCTWSANSCTFTVSQDISGDVFFSDNFGEGIRAGLRSGVRAPPPR